MIAGLVALLPTVILPVICLYLLTQIIINQEMDR